MIELDELPFNYPATLPNPAAVAGKCRHPRGARRALEDGGTACTRCGADIPASGSRRGRNNRARGNAIEREIGHQLGLRRVGQYGGPDDLSGEMFAAQVKSGGAFPERLYGWLKSVPVNAGQTPILVITDAPGPGRKRRALVVLEIEEWIALHGPTP